ncbi:hypothetical protein GQ457_04G027310 [Hibiscus cannabinus]
MTWVRSVSTHILWDGEIKLGRNCPDLSHLFCANDLILFAETDLDQLSVIHEVMEDFCIASGHRVSVSKTQILFSRNCQPSLESTLAQLFGFEKVMDLGKYLRVPFFHKRVTKAAFAYLLDRISARFSGWAARTLSLAGRIILAKSVLQTIPVYVMQSTWIPKRMCEEMEKLIRKFVWGSCNGFFLMRIGYQLVVNKNSLWVQVFKLKYGCRLAFSCTVSVPPYPVTVCDMVDNCGNWDWARLSPLLPQAVLDKVSAIQPPSAALGQDLPGWRWEHNHCFFTRSAYSALDIDVYSTRNFNWRLVWFIQLPQRIRVFLWLAVHDRLLTNVERKRCHLVYSDVCNLCHGRSETLLHVLRDCSMAQSVEFESDSRQVVDILKYDSLDLIDSDVVTLVHELLGRQWEVRIRHVQREAKSIADVLAKLMRGQPRNEALYVDPFTEVSAALLQDQLT